MSPGSTLLFGAIPSHLRFRTADKRALRLFLRTLSQRIARGANFSCLITGDRELQRLNNDFLGHNYPTDVLSFRTGGVTGTLGEIAISVERAAAQADEFGHPLLEEICILMLHGLLHLTGMDHERDRGEMRVAEEAWRAEFKLPRTLIARSDHASSAGSLS